MTSDELTKRLLATFTGELEEQVRQMNADLLALESAPLDAERLRSLFRSAHTIKGASRIVGQLEVEEACHAMETLFDAVRRSSKKLNESHFARLFRLVDELGDAAARLRAGEPVNAGALLTLARELSATDAAPVAEPVPSPARAPAAPAAPAPAALEAGDERRVEDRTAVTRSQSGPVMVRVAADKLEALLDTSGELLVAAARLAERAPEVEVVQDMSERWLADWRADRSKLARLVDENEHAAHEVLARLDQRFERLRSMLGQFARSARDDARMLSRLSNEIGGATRRMHLSFMSEAFESLPRAVRDVAAAEGKEARLELSGGDVEADRAVVDALREPLLHLVRNAVDHGLERPAARRARGKTETGSVRVGAMLKEGRICVEVSDDGSGLNVEALRQRIRQQGMSPPASDEELVRSILAGGVTTRRRVTQISGRGVGLDLVRASLERVRGSVHVRWSEGEGTTFILECPPSPATMRVLLVVCGGQLLALPSTHVRRLLPVRATELHQVNGMTVMTMAGGTVQVAALATLLGPPLPTFQGGGLRTAALLDFGGRKLALLVDALHSELEVMVRPLNRNAANPQIAGGALLPSGRVALVVNVGALFAAASHAEDPVVAGPATVREAERQRILVVDDSITTRALEQNLLESAGYDVVTAVDGQDGWRKLQEQGADLVVADVEMPRMDGILLCETIRRSDAFATLPVVLVTALESAEHRARGLSAGADAYIAKSAFNQATLLETVRQLLGDA
jgi:two-component system, chemotaxis family, sensor kinase CheA